MAIITVADDGIGMNAMTLERAFDPFFTTKPSGKGTDLGMAMVLGIVTHLAGTIDVASRPGAGTTITIKLPAAATDELMASVPEPSRLAPQRILLVEDEAMPHDHPTEQRDGVSAATAPGAVAAGAVSKGPEQGTAIARDGAPHDVQQRNNPLEGGLRENRTKLHSLASPLSSVLILADLIARDQQLAPQTRRQLDALRSDTGRLADMVRRLGDIARATEIPSDAFRGRIGE